MYSAKVVVSLCAWELIDGYHTFYHDSSLNNKTQLSYKSTTFTIYFLCLAKVDNNYLIHAGEQYVHSTQYDY